MSDYTELIGYTPEPKWIILREKSVKKLSFYIDEENFVFTADMDTCSTDVVKDALEHNSEWYYTVVETTINGDRTYSFVDGYNENCDNLKFCLWRQDDNSVKIIKFLEGNNDTTLWIFKYLENGMRIKNYEYLQLSEEQKTAIKNILPNIIRWEDVFDSLKNKEGREIFSYQKKCYVNLKKDEGK